MDATPAILAVSKWVATLGTGIVLFGFSANGTLSLIAENSSSAATAAKQLTYAERWTMPGPVLAEQQQSATQVATNQVAPAAADLPSEPLMTVSVSSLAIRERPEKGSALVAALLQGEQVVPISKQGSWMLVRSTAGQVGWAFGKYLEPNAPNKR
ncbi:MAG: SH3 domain-containing protein [Devosia sp.]